VTDQQPQAPEKKKPKPTEGETQPAANPLQTEADKARAPGSDNGNGNGNGTWVIKPNGQQVFIQPGRSMFIEPGDVVRLGSPDGPPVKFVQNWGRQADNGGGNIYRRENGDAVIHRRDGSTRITSRLGDHRLLDGGNRITQTTDVEGATRRYFYDENGALNRIDFADGTYASTGDGINWKRTVPGAAESEPFYRGELSLEPDGSLKYFNKATREAAVHRLDGTVETYDAAGRATYSANNRTLELQRARQLASDFPPGQKERFESLLDEVARRSDLIPKEHALVLSHVRRLLQHDSGAMLGIIERRALAEQMLFQTINYRNIDQGFNNTCNVTTVEKRIFAQKPSEAIRLIADVATKGKYVTASGVLVDFSRVPGLITPDAEARALLSSNHLRIDGNRSYASQIFEVAAVNVKYSAKHWSEVNDIKIFEGDIVVYEKVKDASAHKGEREQLVKYSVRDGRLEQRFIDDSPYVGSSQLGHIHNEITGGNESGFIFMGSRYPDKKGHIGNWTPGQFGSSVVVVQNAQDLARQLQKAQADGRFPAVVAVHTSHPFFGSGQGGNTGGGHVINIHGIRKVSVSGREQILVDITNQWGVKHNKEITAEQLYALTGPADKSISGGVVKGMPVSGAHASTTGNGTFDTAPTAREGEQLGDHVSDAGTNKPEFSYEDVTGAAALVRRDNPEALLGRMHANQERAAIRAAADADDYTAPAELLARMSRQRDGFSDSSPLLAISSRNPHVPPPTITRVYAHHHGEDVVVTHMLDDGTVIGIVPGKEAMKVKETLPDNAEAIHTRNHGTLHLSNGKIYRFDSDNNSWYRQDNYVVAKPSAYAERPAVPDRTQLPELGAIKYNALVRELDLPLLSDSDLARLVADRPRTALPSIALAAELMSRLNRANVPSPEKSRKPSKQHGPLTHPPRSRLLTQPPATTPSGKITAYPESKR
jgi:YD repeat-containing protein